MEEKNKGRGGRPAGTKDRYFDRKLTLYLTEAEYALLGEFLQRGWKEQNYSSAARFLLLHSLRKWEKKGKREVGLRGEL